MCNPWYTVGTQCGRLQVSPQAGVVEPQVEGKLTVEEGSSSHFCSEAAAVMQLKKEAQSC